MNQEELQKKTHDRMQELAVPFSEAMAMFMQEYNVQIKEIRALFKVTEAQMLIAESVYDEESDKRMQKMTDKMKARGK